MQQRSKATKDILLFVFLANVIIIIFQYLLYNSLIPGNKAVAALVTGVHIFWLLPDTYKIIVRELKENKDQTKTKDFMVNFKPLHELVLILPKPKETVTASGIIIPDGAGDSEVEGVVVAIGTSDKIQVAVGDEVVYTHRFPIERIIEGKKYLLMPHADIVGVV